MPPRAKSHVTYEHRAIKRVEAARKKITRSFKRGKVLKGPALHRLRIKA